MNKRLLPNIEELIHLYVDKKMSCKDICRQCGLSPNSSPNLARMLKKNKISIRKDAGVNHHNWKGGKIKNKGCGYIGIWQPTHPKADSGGYVYEHTLVYEKNTGKLPSKDEVLHHIDLDKHNNNFNNLFLCNHKEHIKIHRSLEKLIPELLKRKIIKFENGEYIII